MAGKWLVDGENIPLSTLREKHREINLPCKTQSYTLRSAFFDHLGKTYGDDAVLAMAKQDNAGALADFEKFCKKDFDALTAEWRAALLSSFETLEGAEEQAKRYREDSPIQYMPVCDASGVVQK